MKATALNSLFEDFLETNRFILVVCAFLMDPLFAEYVHITNNLLFITIEWNERGKWSLENITSLFKRVVESLFSALNWMLMCFLFAGILHSPISHPPSITIHNRNATNNPHQLFQPCAMPPDRVALLHPGLPDQLQRREIDSDLAVVPVHIHHIPHREQTWKANLPRTPSPSPHCAGRSPR